MAAHDVHATFTLDLPVIVIDGPICGTVTTDTLCGELEPDDLCGALTDTTISGTAVIPTLTGTVDPNELEGEEGC